MKFFYVIFVFLEDQGLPEEVFFFFFFLIISNPTVTIIETFFYLSLLLHFNESLCKMKRVGNRFTSSKSSKFILALGAFGYAIRIIPNSNIQLSCAEA